MNDLPYVLKYLKKKDPVIYKAMLETDFSKWDIPVKKLSKEEYFQELCLYIIGQQLSGKAAQKIRERFLVYIGNPVSPAKLMKAKVQDIRNLGLSWAKTNYIKNLAQAYLKCTVKLENLENMDDKQIISEFTKIKGIGIWTAEMFLIFSLGREDVFSQGDLGLKKGLKKLYGLKTVTSETAKNITDKWRPYRSYGSITLWDSLNNR